MSFELEKRIWWQASPHRISFALIVFGILVSPMAGPSKALDRHVDGNSLRSFLWFPLSFFFVSFLHFLGIRVECSWWPLYLLMANIKPKRHTLHTSLWGTTMYDRYVTWILMKRPSSPIIDRVQQDHLSAPRPIVEFLHPVRHRLLVCATQCGEPSSQVKKRGRLVCRMENPAKKKKKDWNHSREI